MNKRKKRPAAPASSAARRTTPASPPSPSRSGQASTPPPLSRAEKIQLALMAVTVAGATYAGWRLLWFLTDDAYIAFRYASNSVFGYGFVWNPPPFRPVEGYTSFLWVAITTVVWKIFGIEPPDAANPILLVFALLTLFLGGLMLLRMRLREELRRRRVLLLGLVMLGVISNRTFLAWASSGLETAMFNFFLTFWIYCALFLPAASPRWLAGTSAAAALAYLTRPDGLLLAAVTLLLGGLAVFSKLRRSERALFDFAAMSPLLVIPVHLLWRRSVYGEWLPNTYYAKTTAGRIWPQSGLRYLLSFIMEYSLWIWIALLLLVFFFGLRRVGGRTFRKVLFATPLAAAVERPETPFNELPDARSGAPLGWALGAAALAGVVLWAAGDPGKGIGLVLLAVAAAFLLAAANLSLVETAVVSTLLLQFYYYTVVIGGDHFEFRVYSHLILLLFITSVWMLDALKASPRTAIAVLVLFVVCSWPIPWTHWAITRSKVTRSETHFLKASVAEAISSQLPAAPGFLVSYLKLFDKTQFWLIDHMVCMRHQEHKGFHEHLLRTLPTRAEGMAMLSNDYPVIWSSAVGVYSWVLPRVNVIDTAGLNDYVIARNPPAPGAEILMAHEHVAMPGYLECFDPNVKFVKGKAIVRERAAELTAEKIVECEQRFAQQVARK